MRNEKYRKYIYWGVTTVVVLVIAIALIFVIIRYSHVKQVFRILTGILAPVIYGAVMAYLLAPIYNRVRTGTEDGLKTIMRDGAHRSRIGMFLGTFVSLLVLCAVVFGLISMMIPELIRSISAIIEALPTSITNLQLWLQHVLANNPDLESQVMQYYSMASGYLQNWISNDVIPNVTRIIGSVSSGFLSMINLVKNLLIGIIVMVYLLNIKDKLVTQAKMIIYGAFPVKIANKVLEEGRFVHSVFGGFIIGKLVDSLIIGVICFVLMSFMNMPYVLLISVIVGVTNVIPFFGPFIGAIPSAFFILLVSPMKCLYFIIFILLLQQFDGNILGPKILGESTGLPSFWVLFSILLFGGIFGFVGMIIAVPTFAVFYKLMTELVEWRLETKRLSGDIGDYDGLQYIDEEQKTYIKK